MNAVMNLNVTIKYGEFLDYVRNYQLLSQDSSPWSYLSYDSSGCLILG